MLLGDQLVQRASNVGRGHRDVPRGPSLLEQDEAELASFDLLVALHRGPGGLAVDAGGLGVEELLDGFRLASGEAERREEAERDRAAVAQARVAGGGLERVREGVAEVQ